MKKLKYAIPTIALFALPWTHWLVYHNLMLAWPDTPPEGAHWMGAIATILVAGVTLTLMS